MLIRSNHNPTVPPGFLKPDVAQTIANVLGYEAFWSTEDKEWVAFEEPFLPGSEIGNEVNLQELWDLVRGISEKEAIANAD